MDYVAEAWPLLIVVLAQVVWVLAAWVGVRHKRVATGQIYCPRCGAAIALSRLVGIALPSALMGNGRVAAAPAQDGAQLCCGSHPTRKQARPSHLLKHGWCRTLAENPEGDMIPSNDSRACAWSIFGAGFGAFPDGSARLKEYFWYLTEVLRERYGGPTLADWNMDPRRNLCEVVGVALEVERRMELEPGSP